MKKVGFAAAGAISALVLLAGCCNNCGPGRCATGAYGAPGYAAPAVGPVYEGGSYSPPTYAPAGPGTIVGPPAGSGVR